MKKVLGFLVNIVGLAAFLYCVLGGVEGALQGALAAFGTLAILCGTVLAAFGGRKKPGAAAPAIVPEREEKPFIVDDGE